MKKYWRGFNLIELLITLVILAILVGIAYPLYQAHMQRAYRHDAQLTLVDLSARLEEYYLKDHSYAEVTLGKLGQSAIIAQKRYQLAITDVSAATYQLTAKPIGAQLEDECGELTLNQAGVRGAKQAGCW